MHQIHPTIKPTHPTHQPINPSTQPTHYRIPYSMGKREYGQNIIHLSSSNALYDLFFILVVCFIMRPKSERICEVASISACFFATTTHVWLVFLTHYVYVKNRRRVVDNTATSTDVFSESETPTLRCRKCMKNHNDANLSILQSNSSSVLISPNSVMPRVEKINNKKNARNKDKFDSKKASGNLKMVLIGNSTGNKHKLNANLKNKNSGLITNINKESERSEDKSGDNKNKKHNKDNSKNKKILAFGVIQKSLVAWGNHNRLYYIYSVFTSHKTYFLYKLI